MGKRFEVTERITIRRPLAAVFAFVSDKRHDPLWRKGVARMEMEPPGPPVTGSRTTEELRFMGRRMVTLGEVTELVPDRRVAFRSLSGRIPVWGYREVAPSGADTEVTYHLAGELDRAFAAFSFALAPMFRRQVAGDLARLKTHLEGASR